MLKDKTVSKAFEDFTGENYQEDGSSLVASNTQRNKGTMFQSTGIKNTDQKRNSVVQSKVVKKIQQNQTQNPFNSVQHLQINTSIISQLKDGEKLQTYLTEGEDGMSQAMSQELIFSVSSKEGNDYQTLQSFVTSQPTIQ